MKYLSDQFLKQTSESLARKLLGKLFIQTPFLTKAGRNPVLAELFQEKDLQMGIIHEVEVYTENDPASHSFRGETPRNQVMFAEPGTLYVYQIYGIHYCINIVSEPAGVGAAVLIRGVIPLYGLDLMRVRRQLLQPQLLSHLHEIKSSRVFRESCSQSQNGVRLYKALTGGPGKLTCAFGINKHLNGFHLLRQCPIQIAELPVLQVSDAQIMRTSRIGIRHAKQAQLRWVIKENAWTSLAATAYRYFKCSRC